MSDRHTGISRSRLYAYDQYPDSPLTVARRLRLDRLATENDHIIQPQPSRGTLRGVRLG